MAKSQLGSTSDDKPVWIPGNDNKKGNAGCRFEKLLADTYRKHEIIIFFKKPPTAEDIRIVKESFRLEGIDPKNITIRKCDNCDIPIQLWQAKNIHTIISTEGVRAGSGPATTTVGESYSLNFFNFLPFDKNNKGSNYKTRPEGPSDRKDKIVIAVLDTGVDTKLVDPAFLWKATDKTAYPKCYKEVGTGWNFINDTADFNDDNPNRHGSIVSQYIINQFRKSPNNAVQIMPLKTHDSNGVGDLFGIICAIHFAISKGANIINASWGFYYYNEVPIPYLKELITETLKKQKILFITAAGNEIDEDDELAKQIYLAENNVPITEDQLRNLAIHNFYPAHLSDDKNSVITVTTTNGKKVSPTQNYSNVYADLGVMADKETPEGMKFQVPFAGSSPADLIGGSSFATAIASGVIGANCKKSLYIPDIKKSDFFDFLAGLPGLLLNDAGLQKKYIKKGIYTKKTG